VDRVRSHCSHSIVGGGPVPAGHVSVPDTRDLSHAATSGVRARDVSAQESCCNRSKTCQARDLSVERSARTAPSTRGRRSCLCRRGVRHERGAPAGRVLAGQAFFAQLGDCGLGFLEPLETHAVQDLVRLRELDVAVVDDLDVVAPRVAEVEAAA
jgi:hypothetical protein